MGEVLKVKKSSRLFAFLGVVFSCLSILACLFSIPLMFHYLQLLQASVYNDLEFCRVRTKEVWKEAAAVINSDKPQWEQERFARAVDALLHKKQQVEFVPNPRSNSPQFVQGAPKAVLASDKTKVSATFAIGSVALPAPKDTSPVLKEQSRPISSVSKLSESLRDSPPPAGSCCTCHRGPIGPPGVPGYDGRPGMDGEDGKPGDSGPPAKLNYDAAALLPSDCPCTASPGDIGAAGPKGPAGKAGSPGGNGEDGKGGDNGIRGEQGKAGEPGKPGSKGPPGDDGPVPPPQSIPPGAPGKTGQEGDNGVRGPDGPAGKPGSNGTPGDNGERGAQGKDGGKGQDGKPGAKGPPGPKGGCTHCPPPRTAPGY